MRARSLFIVGLLALPLLTLAQSSTPTAKDKQVLKKAELAYTTSKKKYTNAKGDSAAKKGYVRSTLDYAMVAMESPVLGPRQKYPLALNLYREVLKVDAKNAEALKWKQQIENIYRSMNRPIPKG